MRTFILITFLTLGMNLSAQLGGQNSFALLGLNFDARSQGLAGNFITAKDQDVNIGVYAPSLLNPKMHKQLSFNQAIHAGKINYGMVSYAHAIKEKHMIAAHIRYVAYGKMTRTDKTGEEHGTFSPFEYVLGVGYSYQINPRISVGGNWNLIGSHLEAYNSYGTAIDLGGTYTNKKESIVVTALAKNIGFQFNGYYEKNRAALPANFLVGFSYRLGHAPFRFSIVAHHLNKWKLAYSDPKEQPKTDLLTGEVIPVKKPGFFEELGQHFTYQIEVLATKNIHFRTGFDYYARKALRLESKPGMAGFSFGLGLYFKRFALDYGFTIYSKAGFNNMITFSANLERMKK